MQKKIRNTCVQEIKIASGKLEGALAIVTCNCTASYIVLNQVTSRRR